MSGGEATGSRALLFSHLARAALFGGLAGWFSSLLGSVTGGWVLYAGCAALAAVGGWVLARPMERNLLLAVLVFWISAGYIYYALRPPVEVGLLAFGGSFGGYVTLGGVVAGLGIGALLGRAVAHP